MDVFVALLLDTLFFTLYVCAAVGAMSTGN